MTKDEAIAFHDSKAWEALTDRERAELQLSVEVLCMPFSVFHESIEKALGRPVFTPEFGLNWNGLKAELAGAEDTPTLEEIIDLIPANKRIVLVQR